MIPPGFRTLYAVFNPAWMLVKFLIPKETVNLFLPSSSISGLMSTTVMVELLSLNLALAWSNRPKAISPEPPATSMKSKGLPPGLAPASNLRMNWSFHRRWTPTDITSFMISYLEATEENT
ncbi:hypothetical protein WICPIJ_007962 [Wickerhamomyces pijperi]|uniref:Uncharacterized protein n=1 Tax=Wickerhamomyces pijperi TaxID=599730 RepID=A0A9P8PYU8_WICPI|nr:hypothetical protein WICPIJ_007962 [Wickerhamomyces pijperi]